MRLTCPDCIAKRRTLLLAKESLSLFIHAHGRRRDREVRSELHRLVNDHLLALQVWEAHLLLHESGPCTASLAADKSRSARP